MSGRTRRLVLAQAALLLLAPWLRADIARPGQVAPQADGQSVHLLRGERAEVPLRAHYGGGGAVTFNIVERPRHGTLSGLRLLGDNRAAIVYQHNGTRAEPADRFSYAARTGSGLVSSPAEVRITVEEPPARLRIPRQIVFDPITAGASQAETLAISNDGGGVLEGRLTISAPWKLGKNQYRIGAGETQKIAVIFQPDEGRDFVGQIRLIGPAGSERTVALAGSARAPVTLTPERLRIDSEAKGNGPRTGSVALTNETDHSLRLHFESSRRIQPIADLILGPRETRKVAVVLLPDRSIPVQEEILLQGDGFRLRLPVEAAVVAPPKIAVRRPIVQSALPSPSVAAQASAAITSSGQPAPRPQAAISRAEPSPPGAPLIAVRARRLKGGAWELTWPRPKSAVAQYLLEERILSLDPGGELQTTWRPLAAPSLTESGESMVAQVTGLAREQLHIVKVTALGAEGTPLWESALVTLAPPQKPATASRRWLLLLGLVLATLLVLRWRGQHA